MSDKTSQSAEGVKVEGRLVPFPRSVSDRARAALAAMVMADGTPFPRPPAPAADDLASWAGLKAAMRARLEASVAPRIATNTATAETVDMGGAVVHVCTPAALESEDRAYLEIHGGGLVYGDGAFAVAMGRFDAQRYGVRAYSVDYRMPPEAPYPAGLDDCIAAYRTLLKRYKPENIIVGGGSAGANLAAALALRARDEGLPLPAALVLSTPELDLTESGDSFEVNRTVDVVLGGSLMASNLLYAAGHDLAHPYLSPLFGDFSKGFPPTFLQAGTRDLFLSNAVRMHRALLKAKVPVELHIFEGMPHGGFGGAPEDMELEAETVRFVREHWAA